MVNADSRLMIPNGDGTSIFRGGPFDGIEIPQNVSVSFIRYNHDGTGDASEFMRTFKSYAQSSLNTEWKMLLDIDEFIGDKPDVSQLNPEYAYSPYIHNLFGNIFTEIIGAGPTAGEVDWGRLHYGNADVLLDGCMVDRPTVGPVFDIWHTTLLRNPDEVANRTWVWKLGEKFVWADYKRYWPESTVVRVDPSVLPQILTENADRFHFADM